MWVVRAEIVGDFVRKETFTNAEKAHEYYLKLKEMGIWDTVEIYKVWNKEGE